MPFMKPQQDHSVSNIETHRKIQEINCSIQRLENKTLNYSKQKQLSLINNSRSGLNLQQSDTRRLKKLVLSSLDNSQSLQFHNEKHPYSSLERQQQESRRSINEVQQQKMKQLILQENYKQELLNCDYKINYLKENLEKITS